MKKELKEKWVKALRSGKYKQGQGYLKRGGAYCCLGVLCAVSDVADWDWEGKRDLSEAGLLERFGLSKSVEAKLIDMSDTVLDDDSGKTKSFKEIASWIDKNICKPGKRRLGAKR